MKLMQSGQWSFMVGSTFSTRLLLGIIVLINLLSLTYATQTIVLADYCGTQNGRVLFEETSSFAVEIDTEQMTEDSCEFLFVFPTMRYVTVTFDSWTLNQWSGYRGDIDTCYPLFSMNLFRFCDVSTGSTRRMERTRSKTIRLRVKKKQSDGSLRARLSFSPKKAKEDEDEDVSSTNWILVGFGIFMALLIVSVAASVFMIYSKRRRMRQMMQSGTMHINLQDGSIIYQPTAVPIVPPPSNMMSYNYPHHPPSNPQVPPEQKTTDPNNDLYKDAPPSYDAVMK